MRPSAGESQGWGFLNITQHSRIFRCLHVWQALIVGCAWQAKQKYEKLLTQCANLTAMIDAAILDSKHDEGFLAASWSA